MINVADKRVKLIALHKGGNAEINEMNEYYKDWDKKPAPTDHGDSYLVYFGSRSRETWKITSAADAKDL